MMKKFTLVAVLLSMSLFASAQSKYVTLSSINGTNVEQYDGHQQIRLMSTSATTAVWRLLLVSLAMRMQ